MSYDRHLDRIYFVMTSDPNVGRWFQSTNKMSFVRYFDEYREVIHKVNHLRTDEDIYENGEGQWTVSIGYKDNHFQVGYKYFNTVKEAKKWADNRNDEDLWILEQTIENWN